MASPVWVSANSLAGANATSAALTVPASVAVNDILVVHFYREVNFAAVTAPDGTWTRKTTVATTTNHHEEQVWWKRCVGGESGTVTFTWTGSAAFRAGGIHRITGAKTSGDPFSDFNTNFNDSASFTTPAVSLTGAPTNSLLLWGASNFNGSSTWTRPAGYAAGASSVVDVGASKDNTAGGSTGSITGSSNQSDTMTAWLGVLSEATAAAYALPQWMIFNRLFGPAVRLPASVPLQLLGDATQMTNVALTDTATGDDGTLTVAAAVPLADTAAADDQLAVLVEDQFQQFPQQMWQLRRVAGQPEPRYQQLLGDTSGATSVALADLAAGDDGTLAVTVAVPLADTATGTDALTVAVAVPLADTATGTDAVTVTAAVPLADTATGDDSLSLAFSTDPFQASPQVAWMFTSPRTSAGQIYGDATTPDGSQSLALPDTATGDDGTLTVTVAVPLADTATGVDAVTIAAAVPLSGDTATGTDAAAVAAAVPLADTATADDGTLTIIIEDQRQALPQLFVQQLLRPGGMPGLPVGQLLGDAGTAITAALSDTATGTDAVAVAADAGLVDTATATDSLAITVTITLADVAAATELLLISSSDGPSVPGGGSWGTLLSITREAHENWLQEVGRRRVSCPNDGTLLDVGPNGELHCSFDGWPADH